MNDSLGDGASCERKGLGDGIPDAERCTCCLGTGDGGGSENPDEAMSDSRALIRVSAAEWSSFE